jgi:hypothetical protein
MRRALRKYRKLFATAMLLAFTAAWVIPAEACLAMTAATVQAGCPDCPSHCAGQDCCSTVAAYAAMLPTATAPAPSLDKAIPVPAILPDYSAQAVVTRTHVSPVGRIPIYSPPSTVNIRFCTFQE